MRLVHSQGRVLWSGRLLSVPGDGLSDLATETGRHRRIRTWEDILRILVLWSGIYCTPDALGRICDNSYDR